jgi:hypothetical protein
MIILLHEILLDLNSIVRGPFANFVDSTYYSESELCGGVVTVSFFEVPPLASDALLTTLHSLLENVLQTVDHFEISCLGASFLWLEKPKNRMRRDLNWILYSVWKKWIGGTSLERPPYSPPDLAPCDFWAFPIMKRELRGKKFRSDQRSAARFREVGGALWEVHRLPREVLRRRDRHRTSTKFWLGVISPVDELCKRSSYNIKVGQELLQSDHSWNQWILA